VHLIFNSFMMLLLYRLFVCFSSLLLICQPWLHCVYLWSVKYHKILTISRLADKQQAQITCQKPGKTLIPIDKPQVYFVDVVKCFNEVYSYRWRIQRCPSSESAHLNSVGNLIPPTTDQPTAGVTWADHRGRACWWVGWRSGLKYSACEG